MAEGFRIASGYVEIQTEDKTDEGKGRIAGGLKAWATVAGAAVAATLGASLLSNLNVEAGTAKMEAQLGLTSQAAQQAGAVAGKVYAGNFGTSMDDVRAAIQAVGTDLVDVNKVGGPELQKLSEKALTVSSIFGDDVTGATRAAASLIQNGLAKNSTEAFDLLTRGYQTGANSSGDFLDTLNEYGPQFEKLGISGSQAIGLLGQGLKGGARDADLVADAFKEFSIRAVDGSKLSTDAFKGLGLDAKATAAAIAAGGPSAQQATAEVIAALQNVKDPLKQNELGVALFGTQFEDLGPKVFGALDPASAALTDVAGATEHAAEVTGGTGAAGFETMKRSVEGWVQSLTQADGPVGFLATGLGSVGTEGLTAAGALVTVGSSFGGIASKAGSAALSVVKAAGSMAVSAATTTASAVASFVVQGAKWAWMGVQALLHAAKIAAAWLISLGPIGLVIAAVVGLVALIIANFDTIKGWISAAWEWVKTVTIAVWNAIVAGVTAYINMVKTVIMTVWNWITGFISAGVNGWKLIITTVWEAIKTAVSTAIEFVKTVISNVVNTITSTWTNGWNTVKNTVSTAWTNIKTAVSSGITGMIDLVKGIPGKITGALGDLGSLLKDTGRKIIQGLIDGVSGMITSLKNKFSSITSMIPSWKGPMTVDMRLLEPSGKALMTGLMSGVDSQVPALRGQLGDITAEVPAMAARGAAGASASSGGSTYHFAPGSIVLDASKMSSIQDLVDLIKSLKTTSRAFGARTATAGAR